METPAFLPAPAEFKTQADGGGGLIKVVLVDGPHDGRAIYIDELDLPAELYTSGVGRAFEWWPPDIHDTMLGTAMGSDPTSPPGRYILRIPEDTREPLYLSADKAR